MPGSMKAPATDSGTKAAEAVIAMEPGKAIRAIRGHLPDGTADYVAELLRG